MARVRSILDRLIVGAVLAMWGSFFAFQFYLSAERPRVPDPGSGFVIPHKVLAVVYITEVENCISDVWFYGVIGMMLVGGYLHSRIKRQSS